ncbi:MAG TPA: cyclopropane-fatty-acyl-phospholipid synthase family protein, partial [Burkholderiales bacterium]|nr:cyclopropane-fatty-acyl-phospholipid synthase family protein [Burkholderiales bacterium]
TMETQLINRFERRVRELGLPLGIRLWNGAAITPPVAPRVTIAVRSPKVLLSLLNPSMGKLARHYVEAELDVEGDARDIVHVAEALSGAQGNAQHGGSRLLNWIGHTRRFDRKAIRHHYDVGDEFYGLWLDPRRVYSCAYFKRADDTLEIAQEQKLDHICRKLQLQPGERFLDVGCGWGALAMWAAQHYQVRALGITLSEDQHDYARRRIREQGLEGQCEVQLLDYRDVPEDQPFDKIASVGMLEHVGRSNLPIYFGKLFRLLKPGGLAMNHGITLNVVGQDQLGSGIGDFINEYVFPGGELVHISRLVAEMAAQGLECRDVESLRPHYAKTLWHWVERLEAQREAAIKCVGEKIFRVWRIYMAGSANSFERGWLSVHQVLAGKPLPDGTLPLPLSRDYIYAG